MQDLSDAFAEIRKLKDEVRALKTPIALENSSITDGRMRFIGGLLRVDSGGRVEIVGYLQVEGTTNIVGPVTISGNLNVTGTSKFTGPLSIEGATTVTGDLKVNGPWALNGNGDITGDVDVTGDLEVLGGGRIKVGNVIITPGSGGKVTVGTGAAQVVLDGATGRIKAGSLTIDPTRGGGAVRFDNGAEIFSATGGQVELVSGNGNNVATIRDNLVQLMGPGGKAILLNSNGLTLTHIPDLPSNVSAKYLVIGEDGRVYKSAGVGGGGTPSPGEDLGHFQWPFPLSTVTSEYGPRWGRIHEGIDFGLAPAVAGAPIIAAGDGTIAVNTYSAGWGNYVRITHNVGGQQLSTLYAHMNAPGLPAVGSSVSKGDVIGYVGNTGNSYGAHLHWECWMGTSYGTHVNPRDFMAAYGPE